MASETLESARQQGRPSGRRRFGLATVLTYLALFLGVAITFLPVLWVVLSSFKSLGELYHIPPMFFPETWILTNYSEALVRFPFLRYLLNSVVVTLAATLITLAINSMAAFALSKYKFRGRDLIFLITLGTLMIPLQVIMIPVYMVMARLNMVNTLWGIIIPPAATPTGVFLLRQYMITLPDEIIEAARIDGAGEWRIFTRIVLPLSAPALAVLTVFSIMWRWNDFLWPLIVVNDPNLFTLQLGLARFRGELVTDWNYVLAMTVLSMLPITLVFAFLQRYLVSGIASTGIKG
ncbi:MAG TPA: carbohydrate ABC transporter permease [Anaerolineae bacterium]|nr:carbohydrate ABC transporter permease [Anaerolineae bacterium]HOQ99283.1 carbohydrate ABC transporter permease [Anaerolineae bacterium]HPL26917.1 carbohydrate ABC transporter permease [Anaerolineae bacterium]